MGAQVCSAGLLAGGDEALPHFMYSSGLMDGKLEGRLGYLGGCFQRKKNSVSFDWNFRIFCFL